MTTSRDGQPRHGATKNDQQINIQRQLILDRLKKNGPPLQVEYREVSLRRAAVLVGLFFDEDEEMRVLLTRRSDKLRSHSGEVCLPGGKADGNETCEATALREANEEIGLHASDHVLTLIGKLPPRLSAHLLSVTSVVALIKTPSTQNSKEDSCFIPKPNPHEVESVFTVPLRFFHDPPDGCYRFFDYTDFHGHMVRIHEYDFKTENQEQYRIWGLTAHILIQVAARVYESVSSKVVLDPPGMPRHVDLCVNENGSIVVNVCSQA